MTPRRVRAAHGGGSVVRLRLGVYGCGHLDAATAHAAAVGGAVACVSALAAAGVWSGPWQGGTPPLLHVQAQGPVPGMGHEDSYVLDRDRDLHAVGLGRVVIRLRPTYITDSWPQTLSVIDRNTPDCGAATRRPAAESPRLGTGCDGERLPRDLEFLVRGHHQHRDR
jgi:hypothetical protein